MEISAFKRDVGAAEEGRWVGEDEVPDLGDIRVKVRGMSAAPARALFDRKQRAAKKGDRDARGQLKTSASVRIMREMVEEWALVDIEGLTEGGKPVKVDRLKELLSEPALEPLLAAIMEAIACVDQTRVDDAETLAGN